MSLQVKNLTVSIADKTLCHDLSISFEPGQFWGIMGNNGVGKSTLLHTLMGFISAKSGHISLDNQAVHSLPRLKLARQMGIMLQEYEYHFPCTVFEAAIIGRHPFIKGWNWEDENDKQLALQSLEKTGIDHLMHRSVNTLSGGEKRRLNLATLLTQNPGYYLLDEPVNHLDIKAQLKLLSLLANQFKQGNHGGIMVIHDPNLAARFCDHLLFLYPDGQWLSGPTEKVLNESNLTTLFDYPINRIQTEPYPVFAPA
jgi:iron complex transport system ATP-binding protein